MDPKRSFCDFCLVANSVTLLSKQANTLPGDGGLLGSLSNLPAPALGALVGGGAGLVTGALSDKPGSMLRHALMGAGLGGLAGWGGPKLMDYVRRMKEKNEWEGSMRDTAAGAAPMKAVSTGAASQGITGAANAGTNLLQQNAISANNPALALPEGFNQQLDANDMPLNKDIETSELYKYPNQYPEKKSSVIDRLVGSPKAKPAFRSPVPDAWKSAATAPTEAFAAAKPALSSAPSAIGGPATTETKSVPQPGILGKLFGPATETTRSWSNEISDPNADPGSKFPSTEFPDKQLDNAQRGAQVAAGAGAGIGGAVGQAAGAVIPSGGILSTLLGPIGAATGAISAGTGVGAALQKPIWDKYEKGVAGDQRAFNAWMDTNYGPGGDAAKSLRDIKEVP